MTDPRAWLESVDAQLASGDVVGVVREVASELAVLAARQALAAVVFGGGECAEEEDTAEAAFRRFRARANKEREG